MPQPTSCFNPIPPPPPKGLPSISDRISSLQLAVCTTSNKSPSFEAKMLSMGGRKLILPSPRREEVELSQLAASSATSPSDPAGIHIEFFDEVSSMTTNSVGTVVENAGSDDCPISTESDPTSNILRCFGTYNNRRENGKMKSESHTRRGKTYRPKTCSTDSVKASNNSRKNLGRQNWIESMKITAKFIGNCCCRSCCGCFNHCSFPWWW